MGQLPVILAMALLVAGVRLGGFALAQLRLPAALQRELAQVPVAVLAALVAATLRGAGGAGDLRLLAALVAGLALWWSRRPWVGLAVGLGAFWLLRWALGR